MRARRRAGAISLSRRITNFSLLSASGDGDVDPEISVVCEELRDGSVEDEAIGVHDCRRDALVDGAGGGLPRQAAAGAVQFESEMEQRARGNYEKSGTIEKAGCA